jgi:transposase
MTQCLLGTMTFIRTKIKDGRKYRYLVENYWDKEKKSTRQRVIQYLGVDTGEEGNENLIPPAHKMEEIERAVPVGKLALYYAAAQYIDLRKALEKHCPSQSFPVLALVMNQVCNRLSLEKAAAWVNNTPLAEWEDSKQQTLTRVDLDNGLGKLCFVKNGIKSDVGLAIQRTMAERCQQLESKSRKHLFYDVTKITYFGKGCSYSEKGYTLSQRGKWTIGVGFVISGEHGFPVRCGAIPGSKNDTLTMEDMLAALESWGYRGIPMIVDRGMLSTRNIKIAREKGFHIIGCCPETSSEVFSELSHWNDEDISTWENAVKRSSEGMVYVKGRKGTLYGQSGLIVVVSNPTQKAMEKANRDMMIKELSEKADKKRVNELKSALSPVIVKQRGRRGFRVDDNLVQQEEFIDGRFLMFCTDQRISAKNVFTIYSQRDEIEKAFRSLKGELSLGPIRYQRPERIDAYLTIAFLAYLLRTIIKFRLKNANIDMSVDQAVDELKNLTLVVYSYKGKVRWKLSRVTKKEELLMNAMDVDKFIHGAYNR